MQWDTDHSSSPKPTESTQNSVQGAFPSQTVFGPLQVIGNLAGRMEAGPLDPAAPCMSAVCSDELLGGPEGEHWGPGLSFVRAKGVPEEIWVPESSGEAGEEGREAV